MISDLNRKLNDFILTSTDIAHYSLEIKVPNSPNIFLLIPRTEIKDREPSVDFGISQLDTRINSK